ncbi:MAG: hypothetical protein POELPBGB_02917 [Bacteroidia bacterium]|nr:hypothetical protein [Bacteroidia bacterium]
MNHIKNIFQKAVLSAFMFLVSGNLIAAETPQVPWRNLKFATETSTFWFLTGLALFLLVLIIVLAGVLKSIVSNKDLWLKKASGNKAASVIFIALMTLPASSAFAQAASPESAPLVVMTEDIFWVLVTVNFVLLSLLFAILLLIKNLLKSLKGEDVSEAAPVKQDIWAGALNAAVPVEREGEIMMDHEYDGIRELDNNLPPWWIWGFYFTIAFAGVYLTYYHITGKGDLMIAEYNKQMEEGRLQKEAYLAKAGAKVDENTVVAFTEAAQLDKGKETFKTYCAACHGQAGEGGVGPNFADEYWIHGGGIKNIFKTVKYGVPAKGMIAWEAQLTPVQIQEVSSYILTLKGTNPANAKEPQGELWSEGGAVPAAQPDSAVADSAKSPVAVNQ